MLREQLDEFEIEECDDFMVSDKFELLAGERVDWLERFVFAKKVESDFLFKNIKTHTQMSFIAVLFIKIRSHQAGHLVFMYDDDDDNDESSENG